MAQVGIAETAQGALAAEAAAVEAAEEIYIYIFTYI